LILLIYVHFLIDVAEYNSHFGSEEKCDVRKLWWYKPTTHTHTQNNEEPVSLCKTLGSHSGIAEDSSLSGMLCHADW